MLLYGDTCDRQLLGTREMAVNCLEGALVKWHAMSVNIYLNVSKVENSGCVDFWRLFSYLAPSDL